MMTSCTVYSNGKKQKVNMMLQETLLTLYTLHRRLNMSSFTSEGVFVAELAY